MAKPANTLVPQLMNATITESLQQLLLNWLKLDIQRRPPNAGPSEQKICVAASDHTQKSVNERIFKTLNFNQNCTCSFMIKTFTALTKWIENIFSSTLKNCMRRVLHQADYVFMKKCTHVHTLAICMDVMSNMEKDWILFTLSCPLQNKRDRKY